MRNTNRSSTHAQDKFDQGRFDHNGRFWTFVTCLSLSRNLAIPTINRDLINTRGLAKGDLIKTRGVAKGDSLTRYDHEAVVHKIDQIKSLKYLRLAPKNLPTESVSVPPPNTWYRAADPLETCEGAIRRSYEATYRLELL